MPRRNKILVPEARKELDQLKAKVVGTNNPHEAKFGLVLPDITNPFFPALARGVEDFLYCEGYHLIIGNSDEQMEKENEYVHGFLQNNVVGLIISTHDIDFHAIKTAKIPVVLLDRTTDEFPAVYADQIQGGKLAATKIIERGCHEVTIIRGPVTIKPVYERFRAAYDVLKKNNKKVNIIDAQLTFESGQKTAKELFEKYPNTDAVLACNDPVAIAILNEAIKQGRQIPEDMQIIGFDNISMSSVVHPGLSTINQPAYEMGLKAAEILLKQINQEKLTKIHYKFPVSFIERESTRKEEK